DAAQQATLAQAFDRIVANSLAAPSVFVHRDFMMRNLMVPPTGARLGVLDFQDAVYGPITYDAVSLLKDAYVAWEEEQRIDWLVRYWEGARAARLPVASDFGDFYRDFEWMGVQRHLKVLGIFARLCHRDGKTGYLADMPRVAQALHAACGRYRELAPLARLLEDLWGEVPQVGYTF
ncbi:MAG: phosphotransferase, partial [Betaproteobacteria bacterium]|nr:phosphotransferase [Betaproteobacteria bacterium]